MSLQSRTLKNNILLITEQVPRAKSASLGFWFAAGSRMEKEGEYGITHFTEHMIFKGTTTRSGRQISCAFDRIGAYLNAYTEREDVCVYCTVPANEEKSVSDAVEIMCDMAVNATFDPVEMEKERAVIESEILAVQDDPEEAALDEVASAVWPGQAISRCIGGTVRDVECITREALCDWYNTHFVHGELVVCAAGHFDEDEIVSILSKLPVRAEVKKYPQQTHFMQKKTNLSCIPEMPVWKAGSSFITAKFKQEQIFVLYPFPAPVSEKMYFALGVFNALTGDTMSSRLFDTLREKSGLCYTVYCYFTYYENAIAWCAYASCEKKNADSVIRLLDSEIEKLKSTSISMDEIEAAKEHLCGEETIGGEDVEYKMKRLARNHEMGFPLRDTDGTIALIRSVTKDDIDEVVATLLDEKSRSFVSYGPRMSLKIRRGK